MSESRNLRLKFLARVSRIDADRRVAAILAMGAVGTLVPGGPILARSAHANSDGHAARNGRIVFQRYVGKVQQLFTVKPDGTGLRQLTHDTQTSENAKWSADGSKIIFDRTPVSTGNALGSLYVINANGSGETPLTPKSSASGYFYETPAWSPSGRQVAFRRYRISPYADGIWIMNTDGSHLRQLTRGPGLAQAGPNDCACDADPRFSPVGRRIVFDREPSAKQAAVFVVNVDGTGLRRLTPWRLDAGEPSWSPDNSLILYSTYLDPHPGKSSNLYTMRPSGTSVRALTYNSGGNGNSSNPAWSPNGKFIVFTHNHVALASHSRNDLYVMPTQGGPARQLTHLAPFDANKADWGHVMSTESVVGQDANAIINCWDGPLSGRSSGLGDPVPASG